MTYEPVLPHDTQVDISEFVKTRCDAAFQLRVLNRIEIETQNIVANPAIGTVVYGGPFESRRIHRAIVETDHNAFATIEFAYRENKRSNSIVFSAFREVPPEE